jgi:hypothetical protein
MLKAYRVARAIVVAVAAGVAAGCAHSTSTAHEASLRETREHYQRTLDLGSLQTLASHLRLGMSKATVEGLLGPGLCVVQGREFPGSQCRYESGHQQHGFTVALQVDYHYFSPETRDDVYTGRVERYFLGPIAE